MLIFNNWNISQIDGNISLELYDVKLSFTINHLINELEMPTTFESMIQVKNPTIQFEYRIPNQNRILYTEGDPALQAI